MTYPFKFDIIIARIWIKISKNGWVMDYDWALLRSFAAVCEHGSISSAARAIEGSQPTISRHISQLEQQIGARLFDRDVRGMALTPAGEKIYAHVKDMSDAAAKLTMASGPIAETLSGSVRITASNIVATFVLPDILSRLRQAEPAISLEVVATDNTENLLRREADIAVRMFRPTQGDVIAKKVGELNLGAFAHEDYIARKGMPTSLADFTEHDIIGYDRAPQIIEEFRRFGLDVDRDFFAFRSDNQVVC